MKQFVNCIILFILTTYPVLYAQNSTLDLTEISLEDLMSIEVTLPSRKAEKLSKSTAAIFVMTHEDIQRSAAVCLPDVLRLIPGLQTSQLDANKWAVSSRGGNSVLSDKLLVLVNGRSVYTPLFSGVIWDSQDLVLDNIERIEVIRGPGGSLWGANAINGIINIITKKARDCQETAIHAGAGTHNKLNLTVSQGGKIDQNSYYHLYAKQQERNPFELKNGDEANDQWTSKRFGARLDLESFYKGILSVQGECYKSSINQTLDSESQWNTIFNNPKETVKVKGGHLLACYNRNLSRDSEISAQLSFDRLIREDSNLIGGRYDQIDFDFQHQKTLNWKHALVWGCGYRLIEDRVDSTNLIHFNPASKQYDVYSAFIQDHIQINKDILRVTLGSKFEYNQFSGFEIQPSIRFLYTPDLKKTTWVSLSRAIRTPSRADHAFRATYQHSDTAFIQLRGNPEFDSEKIIALELGQRLHPGKTFSLDLSLFYNYYNNRRSFEPAYQSIQSMFQNDNYTILPLDAENRLKSKAYGAEIVSETRLFLKWRIRAAYSWLKIETDLSNCSKLVASQSEIANAKNKAYLWSSWTPLSNIQADFIIRYMDTLPAFSIDSYLTCDIQLSCQVTQNIQLILKGRNLTGPPHQEHQESMVAIPSSYIHRSVFGAIECRF